MIRGYFSAGIVRRPFVSARIQLSGADNRFYPLEFLVDTGADRTSLSPVDIRRLGIGVDAFPVGVPSVGVGGQAPTRVAEAMLTLDSFTISLSLTLIESPRPIPSLLGRDILSRFALFLEERTSLVLLLEAQEADNLNLPR